MAQWPFLKSVGDCEDIWQISTAYEDWREAEKDTWVGHALRHHHEVEREAYNRVRKHQGRAIPQLFATVALDSTPPKLQKDAEGSILFKSHSLLMQYLDGFIISELGEHPPKEQWLDILQDACAGSGEWSTRPYLVNYHHIPAPSFLT